jgi:DNA-binding beta-propeller fold protein YncE
MAVMPALESMCCMSSRPGSPRGAVWSRRVVTLAALASIPLHGCGGTGDDPIPDAPDSGLTAFPRASCDAPLAPPIEPQLGVHIVFPPASSLTYEDTILVRGTAVLDTGVAAIRVNGVAAQSADGFRTWQVSVPLAAGANTLVVESEDAAGQIDPAAAQAKLVKARVPLYNIAALALDAPANRVLLLENGRYQVVAVDLDTGARSYVFDPSGVGEGTPPLAPPSPFILRDLALDPTGKRVFVLTDEQLIGVDVATGEATILSDATTGSGPMIGSLVGMALDAAAGRALVLNPLTDTLLAIDLDTGARTVIADAATGSGKPLLGVTAVALDDQANRALVTTWSWPDAALVAVDLSTGDRTVISGLGTGAGVELSAPVDVVLDAANQRALLTDFDGGKTIAVDLGTGDRALFSDEATTSGPLLEFPTGMAVDATRGRVLIFDGPRHSLFGVDLQTEARTVLLGEAIGSGYELRYPNELVLDPEARRVLVYDDASEAAALVAIDPETSARSVISSDTVGEGPLPEDVWALALDSSGPDGPGQPGRQRVLAAGLLDEETIGIFAVDLATGDRTVLSGGSVGAGPALGVIKAVLVDEARNRVLAGMISGLMAVDLDTGDRTLLSSEVGWIELLALEPECDRVLFGTNSRRSGLFALELETDQVSLIADSATCPDKFLLTDLSFYDAASGRVVLDHYLPRWRKLVDTRSGTCTEEGSFVPGEDYPPYGYLHAAVFDPATRLLLLVDPSMKSLVAMDPETGARVILSR